MSERYVTTLQLAKNAKDWALVALLGADKIDQWFRHLLNVFQSACINQDDGAAVRYFGMWMRTIDDGALMPFVRNVKGEEVLFEHEDGALEALAQAREKAAEGRATWARDARHMLLPNPERLTMPETRQAIFAEIANRWRTTPNEGEADDLFDFMTEAVTANLDERKLLINIFRKTTDASFPLERLTRHFLRYYGHRNPMSDIANVLAIGRTRNAVDIANEISLVRHLEGCSDPAFGLAEEFASAIGALDRAVLTLRQAVQSEKERRGGREHDGILHGDIEFSYQGLATVLLLICQRHRDEGAQDWGHAQFELARTRVESWKAKNPNVSVQLTMTIKGTFVEEVVFTRKQKL